MCAEQRKNERTSNITELSLALLLGGAALLAVGARLRMLAAVPLMVLGAAAAAGGASLRPEANKVVGSVAGEEQLWVKFKSSVSVMKPARDIYDYWRDPENWPKFMPDIDVFRISDDRYELIKRVAPGIDLRQEILLTEDLPYHKLAWVSLGEELPHRGSVELTTNGGTYVTLTWEYKLAIGPAVNATSKQMMRRVNEVLLLKLQRFKQIMETGGATILGATAARSTSTSMLWHILKSDADRAFQNFSEPATTDA
jgi:uncharacterized membrane protein